MTRKARCSNCGQWYYSDYGLMIIRPSTYDSTMCPNCNSDIDAQIESRTPDTRVYGKLQEKS